MALTFMLISFLAVSSTPTSIDSRSFNLNSRVSISALPFFRFLPKRGEPNEIRKVMIWNVVFIDKSRAYLRSFKKSVRSAIQSIYSFQ
jgi:hypothetical protein